MAQRQNLGAIIDMLGKCILDTYRHTIPMGKIFMCIIDREVRTELQLPNG
jgi:hypothetical protein